MAFSLSCTRSFYYRMLCLCALLVACIRHIESCSNGPVWLFSLPEDLREIYPDLEEPFIIVRNGEVNSVLNNPQLASIFALPNRLSEFPLVMFSTGTETVYYNMTLLSANPENLGHPLISIPGEGVLPTTPYRFHTCFPCLSSSNTYTNVNITLRTMRPNGEEYCQASFFFSKNCNSRSERFDVCSSNNSNLAAKDGFINVTGILNENSTSATTTAKASGTPVSTILASTILPIAFLCLVMGVFVSWMCWYRNRNKKTASFQPEAVSLAYQGIYSTWNSREPHEKEFPMERLNLSRELGEGAFGVVYEATAEGIREEGVTSVVAVKQLRGDGNSQLAEDFFREVDFMSRLDHPKVVSLLGVCSQQEPFAMVFEYMDLGDLRNFLRDAAGLGLGEDDDDKVGVIIDNPLLTKPELLSIALQVAEGMVYISSKHLIHRDLATRNCLVATGLVVKIADFGMSRDVYSSDYYRVHGSAMLPVRWMPPEAILYGKFSTQTDVWAFGILLWEIFTFGQQPYTGLSNEEVIKCVERGECPEIPPECPVSQLMKNCWKRTPKSRPRFEAIRASLKILFGTSQ